MAKRKRAVGSRPKLKHPRSIGDYNNLATRLDSFAGRWPHKRPTPEHLANAGFFYDPDGVVTGFTGASRTPRQKQDGEQQQQQEEGKPGLPSDNCRCPSCEVCLDGWEPEHDPWQEHSARSPTCRMARALLKARQVARAKAAKKAAVAAVGEDEDEVDSPDPDSDAGGSPVKKGRTTQRAEVPLSDASRIRQDRAPPSRVPGRARESSAFSTSTVSTQLTAVSDDSQSLGSLSAATTPRETAPPEMFRFAAAAAAKPRGRGGY
jgi:hypothetical protein